VLIRKRVHIDGKQLGFSPGKDKTDAIFIVRQMQERHLLQKEDLWLAGLDFEKAFDRVQGVALRWALRYTQSWRSGL